VNIDRSSWLSVRFGEVVRNVNESVRDLAAAGVTRAVGLEHLDSGALRIRRWADARAGTTFTRRFRPGQVLFGKRRVYQRKAAEVDFDGVCSGDILVFEAIPDRLTNEFLPFVLHSDSFLNYALTTSAGSLSPRTKWADLARYTFKVPPLDEQHRMAELLWSADGAQSKNTQSHLLARDLEIATLRETYDDDSWPLRKVYEAGEVQLGLKREPKVHSGTHPRPYLRVANVGDDELFLDDILSMNFIEKDFKRYQLHSGDILLNEGQSLELVGRCSIYRGEISDCCFQMTLLRFRCGSDILPEFAYGWFRRCFHLGVFSRVAARTTSMAHLTARIFSGLSIPVPSLDVQREVVERVEAARALRRRLAENEEAARRLRPQLLNHLLMEQP
jgi:type I restriction enzyme, S subunit